MDLRHGKYIFKVESLKDLINYVNLRIVSFRLRRVSRKIGGQEYEDKCKMINKRIDDSVPYALSEDEESVKIILGDILHDTTNLKIARLILKLNRICCALEIAEG